MVRQDQSGVRQERGCQGEGGRDGGLEESYQGGGRLGGAESGIREEQGIPTYQGREGVEEESAEESLRQPRSKAAQVSTWSQKEEDYSTRHTNRNGLQFSKAWPITHSSQAEVESPPEAGRKTKKRDIGRNGTGKSPKSKDILHFRHFRHIFTSANQMT